MQMNFFEGDVLATNRCMYKHYGIYSGNGNVIHFVVLYHGKRNIFKFRARETSLDEFTRGQSVFVDNSPSSVRYSREKIVNEARKYIDKKFGKGYNLLTNNCEHFVYWCESGRHVSMQINGIVDSVGKVLRKPLAGIRFAGDVPLPFHNLTGQKKTKSFSESINFTVGQS